MKKYKGIIFDWDGTAVSNRNDLPDELLKVMIELLSKDIKLVIVSGTTYDNICHGKLHEHIPKEYRKNMFLCLGRGIFNYGFNELGELNLIHDHIPTVADKTVIDQIAFDLHKYLYKDYEYETDIVFTRKGYVKVDIMPFHKRGDQLYMTSGEDRIAHEKMQSLGIENGIFDVIDKVHDIAKSNGTVVKVTTDGKYIEIGKTTKSDNIEYFVSKWLPYFNETIEDYAFFGDEFGYIIDTIKGSDAHMIIDESKSADFFDVSMDKRSIPSEVKYIGGGPSTFLTFLKEQVSL